MSFQATGKLEEEMAIEGTQGYMEELCCAIALPLAREHPGERRAVTYVPPVVFSRARGRPNLSKVFRVELNYESMWVPTPQDPSSFLWAWRLIQREEFGRIGHGEEEGE